MRKKSMEQQGEENPFQPLSTEYSHLHSRTLEEFPEGSYGGDTFPIGKQSGWDSGEEVNPRFSYENEALHDVTQRRVEAADPIRHRPEGKEE